MPVDNTAKITKLQKILEAGATTVTVDGTTVTYDFDQIRREIMRLQSEDDTLKSKRPRVASIRLSGL
jgi:hypothetical protein